MGFFVLTRSPLQRPLFLLSGQPACDHEQSRPAALEAARVTRRPWGSLESRGGPGGPRDSRWADVPILDLGVEQQQIQREPDSLLFLSLSFEGNGDAALFAELTVNHFAK